MSTKDIILKQLADNPIIIYMKGLPSAPQCGFSAKTIDILNSTNVPFAYVDVLNTPFIREKLPSISKWPTYPQLFVNGELVGGADIVEAMFNEGSLLPLLKAAVRVESDNTPAGTATSAEVKALIEQNYANAAIYIEGEGCNLTISVISEQFQGLSMMKQHQGVMAALNELLASGRLHAVTLKTFTPDQWQALKSAAPVGLLQIQL